jgi:hypothetical protein
VCGVVVVVVVVVVGVVVFFFEIFITFVFQRISDVNLFASKMGGGGKMQMGVR